MGDCMKLFSHWEIWVIIYLISAVLFAQSFKKANRNMQNASALTVLLELSTSFFALFFIPLFPLSFSSFPKTYLILFIVTIIYAITDRLNIEARYGLEPSTFSMLKQLSTVFMIFFGLFLLKEEFSLIRITGSVLIILANLLLTFEKGKIKINKYFLMCVLSNFLFAVAMLINVNISSQFNLAIYTIITVFIPSIMIITFEKLNLKKLVNEFNLYNKKLFLLSGFTWCLMLLSSVEAYKLGNVTIVAPLFALTSLINSLWEYLLNKNRSKLLQNVISAILLILGVILIKL